MYIGAECYYVWVVSPNFVDVVNIYSRVLRLLYLAS